MAPSGSWRLTGPETRSTDHPCLRAASAKAKPILPVDGLLINRTGSINSWVGPAVIKQRSELVFDI